MPNCLEIDLELATARKAHDSILENAQFVQRESVEASWDGEVRAKILLWSNDFVRRWTAVTKELDELTNAFKNYHRIHPSMIRTAIENQCEQVNKMVMAGMADLDFQRSLPPEAKRVHTALSKMISSASDIYGATDELRAFVKTDTTDPYNGLPYPHWEFNCKKCGAIALEVTLIPSDAAHPLQNQKVAALLLATHKNSDQEQKTINPAEFEKLTKCLNKSDFVGLKQLSNTALIYCTTCKGLYCWADWSNKEGVYEDSLYDHTEATCPQGHRQQIDD